MKSFFKMVWVETKLYVREPVAAFFTLIFPLMMLFIFGIIYSNTPETGINGQTSISTLIPSFSAMVIGITGLMAITITMATYRENGILRRLSTTPVGPLKVLGTQVVVVFSMTTLGMLLLILAGKLFYGVQIETNIFSLFAGFVLAGISFFGIGFVLAGILPTARTAQIIAMVLMYPMLILSGAAWPRELMPAAISKVASFFPLTYVVNLLRGLWLGDTWGSHWVDVVVLLGLFAISTFITMKTFRWE